MMFIRRAAMLVAAAGALGCASQNAQSGAGSAPVRAASRTVITNDEMQAAQANNLLEAVQRIHPEWLRQRNAATFSGTSARPGTGNVDVQVFVDGQHTGGSDALREMPLAQAGSLHYYTAAQAEAKFGTGFPNGVIQVVSPGKNP